MQPSEHYFSQMYVHVILNIRFICNFAAENTELQEKLENNKKKKLILKDEFCAFSLLIFLCLFVISYYGLFEFIL